MQQMSPREYLRFLARQELAKEAMEKYGIQIVDPDEAKERPKPAFTLLQFPQTQGEGDE